MAEHGRSPRAESGGRRMPAMGSSPTPTQSSPAWRSISSRETPEISPETRNTTATLGLRGTLRSSRGSWSTSTGPDAGTPHCLCRDSRADSAQASIARSRSSPALRAASSISLCASDTPAEWRSVLLITGTGGTGSGSSTHRPRSKWPLFSLIHGDRSARG